MSKKDKQELVDDNGAVVPSSVNVKVKKRGGCGTFLLGFIFAFVLMLVVVVGAGLYLYYNMSIQKVESMFGVTIPVEGDIKNMALKDLLAKTDKLVNVSLDTLNTEFKVELPDSIPGTKIDLSATYEEQITFLGETKKVKEFRIQDIVNNLTEFVEAVLPKLYDHVTVGQITETVGTTILDDLGYPALKDKFYNVGTESAPEMKTLSELTLNQALDLVPAYFSQDTMTVQMALDALGSDLLPEPAAGETDIYAELRTLKISEITTDTISDKITGEILLSLVDLSAYDFLNTDEFKATKVKDLGTYITSLQLGEFVELNTVVAGDTATQDAYFAKPQYSSLSKTLKLSKLKETILGLKINQIFNATDVARITSVYSNAGEQTIVEFLNSLTYSDITFETATGDQIDCASYGGYVALIADAKASSYATIINDANIQVLLGGADLVTPIAKLAGLTIDDIVESDNAVDTLLNNFGTLGELVGGSAGGIFDIIKDVTIQDLLNNPADAINDKLETSTKTLADLLGAAPAGANEIITTVMGITVGELFTNGSTAITDAISTKTLGSIMGLTAETTGFVKYLANVQLGDLMGANAVDSIKNALTTSGTGAVTLGDFLEINTESADVSGVLKKMAAIEMSALLGNSTTTANPSAAIQEVMDALTLEDVFGEYSDTMTPVLKELYNMTTDDPEGQGGMLINNVFTKINDIKLSVVVGSTKPSVLNLISNYDDLTLGNISSMNVDTEHLTIQKLIDAGLVEDTELKDSVKGMTVQEAINLLNELPDSTTSGS